MRHFTVTWDPRASLEVLAARTYLGVVRAAALDDELVRIRERLEGLPESGKPVEKSRGTWSTEIRKVSLSQSPYQLYYRVNLEAQRVVIFCLRHEKRRPLRL
jgi:plasmid stabilization system protein ParE